MSLKPHPHRRFSQKSFSSRSSVIESNGPQGKVRGTLSQLVDRYLSLGRDSMREGDSFLADSFFQHAEHYRRLLNDLPAPRRCDSASAEEGCASRIETGEVEEPPLGQEDPFF